MGTTLGISRKADAQEIKRAYRKEALRWHPDKNSAPEAEDKFREVARCYEELTNPSSSGSAPRGGFSGGMERYDSARAFRTFDDLFGSVHQRWRPGMTVSGTIVSQGKKIRITISPDGATEEQEESVSSGRSYSSIYTSDGRSTSIQINGDPRELILDLVKSNIPFPTLLMPAVSFVLFTVCHPLLICAACGYCCCFRGSSKGHYD